MDRLEKKVDFDSINRHIEEEGLDITIIRIIYKDLTEEEFRELQNKQEAIKLEEGKILAAYPSDLKPLYKDKATGVLYLGA